jgi:hypothetical protein
VGRVLRGRFGPKRKEGTGDWGKLHGKREIFFTKHYYSGQMKEIGMG